MAQSTTTLSHLLAHSMMSCLCEAISEGTSLAVVIRASPAAGVSAKQVLALVCKSWPLTLGMPSRLITAMIRMGSVRQLCMHSISRMLLFLIACVAGSAQFVLDPGLSLLSKLWGTLVTVSGSAVTPCSSTLTQLLTCISRTIGTKQVIELFCPNFPYGACQKPCTESFVALQILVSSKTASGSLIVATPQHPGVGVAASCVLPLNGSCNKYFIMPQPFHCSGCYIS